MIASLNGTSRGGWTLFARLCEESGAVQKWDQETLTCLRACVMKPEHRDWVGQILQRIDLVAEQLELT